MRWAALMFVMLCACPRGGSPYADGRGIEGQLEREVVALQQTVRVLQAQADSCAEAGPPSAIFAELHQVLKSSEANVDNRGAITMVTLRDDTLFSQDTLEFREEARMALDMVATAIKVHPEIRVSIEGHTDDNGVPPSMRKRYDSPWSLSFAKADAVRALLSDDFGLEADRFTVRGRAGHEPVGDNDTDAGKAANRRVVVYIHSSGAVP
jgi:flagellar motor protein MotB